MGVLAKLKNFGILLWTKPSVAIKGIIWIFFMRFLVMFALFLLTFASFELSFGGSSNETASLTETYLNISMDEVPEVANGYPVMSLPKVRHNAEMKATSPMLILLWNEPKTFDNRIEVSKLQIPNSNCYLTSDRSLIEEASAIVFHSLQPGDMPEAVSQSTRQRQRWVFASLESPTLHSKKIQAAINWTMTYRLDSDIPLPFGRFIPQDSDPRQINIQSKTRMALALASDNAHSESLAYIKELNRFLAIEMVDSIVLDSNIVSKYKFYIVFEDSLCGDYLTEKFYQIAGFDVIPVVYNGVANMKQFAPPRSYINAGEFETPAKLADYLLKVANDEELYKSYFQWKSKFKPVISTAQQGYLDLCQRLNEARENPELYSKSYEDIDKWWREDRGFCYPGIIYPNQMWRGQLHRVLMLMATIIFGLSPIYLLAKLMGK